MRDETAFLFTNHFSEKNKIILVEKKNSGIIYVVLIENRKI